GMNGDIKSFQHGGIAGLLNYDLFSTRSEYGGSDTSLYSQASLEGGINISDWSLRSRYILTDDNGDKNVESVYTFAEHVFDALKMTAQVGEINVSSYVLSGAPIVGV
ncbi:fimbria/pilus outer membrane usher protein, partial [Klebsiella pneumoniae]